MTLASRYTPPLLAALLALTEAHSAPPEVAPPPRVKTAPQIAPLPRTKSLPVVAPPPRLKAAEIAADTRVWLTKLSDGSAQARRRRQPVLVRIGSESCVWCRKLEVELRDPALGKELDRWTLVALDVNTADRDVRALAIGPIPALRILTPDGRVVSSQDGFLTAAELTAWLRKHRDRAAVVPAEELSATGPPDAAAIGKLIAELNQRDPALREAAIRRLLPHSQLAAKPVSETFAKGTLQARLATLELLREWQAPVGELDPWRPETVTAPRLEALAKWAATAPTVKPAAERPLNPDELKSVRLELARFLAGTAAEADAARERLARHGPRLLPEVTATLKDATTDSARERLTALRYRLAAGDRLVLQWPDGIDRLASGHAAVRHEAVQELARRATPAEEPLLLELFGNPDPFVRELSLRTLFAVAGRTATESLTRLLRDPDPNVRAAVLKQLADAPSQSVVPKIAEYLKGETDLDLVVHAIRVLRAAGGDAAAAQLMPLLKNTGWRIRADAVEALGECSAHRENRLSDAVQKDVHSAIREALADTDGFVIGRAIGVLKKTASKADVEPLAKAAAAHPELAGEVVVALASGSSYREEALPHLRGFCTHADPAVRTRAIAAVVTAIPDDEAAPVLRAGLTDRISLVREAAAAQVFNLLDRKRSDVAPSLDRFGEKRDAAKVAEAADEAIAKIRTGKEGRPKGLGELAPLLEGLLKAEAPGERLEAALALIAFDRGKDAVPVLLAAVRAQPPLVARASGALPWLPWAERLDLFGPLAALGESEALEAAVRNFARVPDARAAVPLWELSTRKGAAAVSAIASGLLELNGVDRFDEPSATDPNIRKLVETAKTKATAGPEMQRVTALVVLTSTDPAAAAKVAKTIYEDTTTDLPLRSDAFQVMLVTQKEDVTAAAVKALSQDDARIRRSAVRYLVVGTNSLRQLRDKQIYINTPTRHYFGAGRSGANEYVPDVPKDLPREVLQELLRDADPMTAASAGYLLALLGDDSGLPVLMKYWRETAPDDSEWIWLVVMAIAKLDADAMIPVVEEIYRAHLPKKATDQFHSTQIIRDIYGITRPMTGPNAVRLRKAIRDAVGLPALGDSDRGP